MYLYPRLSRGYSRDNKLEFQKKKKKKTEQNGKAFLILLANFKDGHHGPSVQQR